MRSLVRRAALVLLPLLAGGSAALSAQADPAACAARIVSFADRPGLASPEHRLDLSTADGARLLYFGASHSSDPAHAQFPEIEAAFEGVRPTVVFYEGPARGEAATAEETIRQFGESGFVRFLARRGGARIERLEPDPRAEAAAVLERFSPEQVKLFYVLREVSRLRERRGLGEPEVRAAAGQMMGQMASIFPELAGVVGSVDELEAAYRRHWSEPAEWWRAPAGWFDPARASAETGGVFTNEVNRASSEFRDLHMFAALAREVLAGERVLAVVGRDHVAAQAPALRCALSAPADTVAMGGVEAALYDVLAAEVAASPSLPGELLHVHAPAPGIDATLVAGVAERASGRPLRPDHGFRVASVTKTFVAVAVLRLVEEGRIGLDDPVGRVLPAGYAAVLREGGYDLERITVRHLLTHTGGVYDYAMDERYFAAVFADPARRWTPMEQVRAAMAWGSPRFEPGAGFHYSDTGYVLLGALLEHLSGMPLAAALRSLVGYGRLGLEETYLETLEPAPAGAGELTFPYFGDQHLAGMDASVDLYGGGGLVSTARDLARFYRALLRGEVLRHPETLEVMRTVPAHGERAPGGAYAMGLQRRTIGGEVCWGHTGFWGTAAYHCPASDVTLVRHVNQARPGPEFVFRALFDRIAEVLEMGR